MAQGFTHKTTLSGKNEFPPIPQPAGGGMTNPIGNMKTKSEVTQTGKTNSASGRK